MQGSMEYDFLGKVGDDFKFGRRKQFGLQGFADVELDCVVDGLLLSNVTYVGVGVGNALGPDIHFHQENTINV